MAQLKLIKSEAQVVVKITQLRAYHNEITKNANSMFSMAQLIIKDLKALKPTFGLLKKDYSSSDYSFCSGNTGGIIQEIRSLTIIGM